MMTRSRRLVWTPIVVLAAAGGLAVSVSPVAAAGLLVLLFGAALLLLASLNLPLLLIMSGLNRLALPAGDTQIRVELLVVVIVAAVLLNRFTVRTMSLKTLKSPLTWPLLLYLFANVASSLLVSPERTRGLKLDAEILASVLTFLLVIALTHKPGDLERALSVLWVVTVGEAAVGLLFVVGYFAHLGAYGVQLGDFGLPMAYGTQWEANIFGSFLLGNFFLLLGDFSMGRKGYIRAVGLVLVIAGIVASMTRTVWIALLIGLVIFALVRRGRDRPVGRMGPIMIAVPFFALGGLIVGSATPFASRILDVVNLHSSSASGRIAIFSAALADWRSHPLLGMGTGSFNNGAIPGQAHPWLPNLFLLTLHDTGVVGISSLTVLAVAFYRYAWKAMRRSGADGDRVAGAIAAFSSLIIAFQTTSGFWFTYTWIVVGLGVALARAALRET